MAAIARITAVCFLFFSAGCAQKTTVMVDAVGGAHREQRYVILPGMPDVRADDLYFSEYKGHVAQLMTNLGYTVVDTREEADAAVFLSYSAQAAGMPAYYREAPGIGVGMGFGSGRGYYNPWSFFGLGIEFNQPYRDTFPSQQYVRRIVLDAVDLSTAEGPDSLEGVTSLWKVTLTSVGQSESLRRFFPAMVKEAGPYIGRDTHGPVSAPLKEEDR